MQRGCPSVVGNNSHHRFQSSLKQELDVGRSSGTNYVSQASQVSPESKILGSCVWDDHVRTSQRCEIHFDTYGTKQSDTNSEHAFS